MKRMDGKDLTSTTFMNTMFNKNVDCHPTPSVLRFSVLLNKVWDLGLVLLVECSGGAYKKQGQVWFWRLSRAGGLSLTSGVVLHDSWCVGLLLFCKLSQRSNRQKMEHAD
jgi:hypothetical protein